MKTVDEFIEYLENSIDEVYEEIFKNENALSDTRLRCTDPNRRIAYNMYATYEQKNKIDTFTKVLEVTKAFNNS